MRLHEDEEILIDNGALESFPVPHCFVGIINLG